MQGRTRTTATRGTVTHTRRDGQAGRVPRPAGRRGRGLLARGRAAGEPRGPPRGGMPERGVTGGVRLGEAECAQGGLAALDIAQRDLDVHGGSAAGWRGPRGLAAVGRVALRVSAAAAPLQNAAAC